MTDDAIPNRLRALLGSAGIERDADGLPRAVPDSAEAVAMVCQLAHQEGWKVRVEGQGTWLHADAPADFSLSTRALQQVLSVSPADLVATVQAGTPFDVVRRQLAEHETWLAADPPGRPDRSIGSIVATATSGPLRYGFGAIRDHILGCTVVTGDGRIVRAGGRVVKNVAGYDLTKLQVGGFGGFGIITELHLRLRALPRADTTLIAQGTRDRLTSAARDLGDAGVAAGSLELLSPALAAEAEWTLAVRVLGTEDAVQAETRRITTFGGLVWQQLPADRSAAFWGLVARGALGGPVTFRLGVLRDGLDDTIDLLAHHLDDGLIAAGAGNGLLRWTGEATVERLRTIRRTAAAREIPMTLERAPWPLRHALGHFGAYREGVGHLVGRLRDTFDPGGQLSVALEGAEHG